MATDGRDMVAFTLEVWFVIGLISACALLAILSSAAMARREECRLHDLKIRVHELRSAYQRRLAELRRGIDDEVIEAEVVEEPEDLAEAA